MHKINPMNIEDLIIDIFDGGKDSINQFQVDFSAQVLLICEHIKNSYGEFLRFDTHPEADEQYNHLTAHVYALVESLYTSTKLLVHGFLAPSGNQFRVALESLALSVLLSWRGQMLVPMKHNSWKERSFYADFTKEERWASSHLAIKILSQNKNMLGLSEQAISLLEASKKLYNNYSHVSFLSIRATIVTPEKILFGGGYDTEQKDLFATELDIRLNFVEKVPQFLSSLYERVA